MKVALQGVIFIPLLMVLPGVLLGDPLTPVRPPLVEPEIAAVDSGWGKAGQVLIIVDTISGLKSSEFVAAAQPIDDQTAAGASTPEGVAAANGYITHWFGSVMAIAPSTISVLNTDPQLRKMPLDSLIGLDPGPYLLASLTQDQFTQLSSAGLGISDLTSEQQDLFRAMIPDPILLIALNIPLPDVPDLDDKDSTSERAKKLADYQTQVDLFNKQIVTVPRDQVLDQIRLHAYVSQMFTASDSHSNSESFPDFDDNSQNSAGMELIHGPLGLRESNTGRQGEIGRLLNPKTDNFPKPSDFDWTAPNLSVPVAVGGIRTVDDLVHALAASTGLELYADLSYGQDKVLIAGDLTYRPSASELMQSLALCVAGTWRRVGPAYILTDDLMGFATREQELTDIISSWGNRLTPMARSIGRKMIDEDWITNLKTFPGDQDVISEDLLKKLLTDVSSTSEDSTMNWSDVPASIQNALKSKFEADSENADRSDPSAVLAPSKWITPTSKVSVDGNLETALELPGDGIMRFKQLQSISAVPDSGNELNIASKLVFPPGIRAAIIAPTSAADAVKAIDLLPQFGINTAMVDVFNNGRAYFENAAIPAASSDAASVLTASLNECKIKHIRCLATIDLLCWRKDGASQKAADWPSPIDQDLSVLGEPADAGYRRRTADGSIFSEFLPVYDPAPLMNDSWVSPLDPNVRSKLLRLITYLAGTPGVTGIVIQDGKPDGYGKASSLDVKLELGYTQQNRLQYLRRYHVDPIDINSRSFALMFSTRPVSFRFGIPGFHRRSSQETTNWIAFCQNGDSTLVKSCYSAALAANPTLSVFVRSDVGDDSICPFKGGDVAWGDEDDGLDRLSSSIPPVPLVKVLDSGKNQVGTAVDLEIGNVGLGAAPALAKLAGVVDTK